jgi:hypothetical protein
VLAFGGYAGGGAPRRSCLVGGMRGCEIGTNVGEQLARRLLSDARFVDIEVHPAPDYPGDAIYLSRREQDR